MYSRRQFGKVLAVGAIVPMAACLSTEVDTVEGELVEPGLFVVRVTVVNTGDSLEDETVVAEISVDGTERTQKKDVTIGADSEKTVEFEFEVDESLAEEDIEYGAEFD